MSTAETYWYITCKADTLRTLFGGDTIVNGGGGDNVLVSTLTQRQTIKQIGTLVANKTVALCRSAHLTGTSTSTVLKVSNSLVAALEPYLHADEWASRTQTNIIAGSGNGIPVEYQINPNLWTVYLFGDSITEGTGVNDSLTNGVNAASVYHYSRIAHNAIDTNIRSESFFTSKAPSQFFGDKSYYGNNMVMHRLGVGGSSYANTDGTGNTVEFMRRLDLKYNQLCKILNTNSKTIICVNYGTNDIAYSIRDGDGSLTAAKAFARETLFVGKFRADHPQAKILIKTDVKRNIATSGNETPTSDEILQNQRLSDLNALRRANYASIGADGVVDFENSHADFNCLTGKITYGVDGLYASNTVGGTTTYDLVHPSRYGHAYMANALISKLQAITGL
jgi:lysophospholipase L1-like esterase